MELMQKPEIKEAMQAMMFGYFQQKKYIKKLQDVESAC